MTAHICPRNDHISSTQITFFPSEIANEYSVALYCGTEDIDTGQFTTIDSEYAAQVVIVESQNHSYTEAEWFNPLLFPVGPPLLKKGLDLNLAELRLGSQLESMDS